ncbi:MBL fold metallo-hydrolase, partial [Escherichia coli]|nr:MBL fold metallo-hydrolase [Escherichia coli]
KVHQILPDAQIVATHMEAVNHCLLTREELLAYARDNQIQEWVSAPADGESVTI